MCQTVGRHNGSGLLWVVPGKVRYEISFVHKLKSVVRWFSMDRTGLSIWGSFGFRGLGISLLET